VDPIAFAEIHLDQDEKAAKAATEGPWKVEVFNRNTGRQEWVVIGRAGSHAVITGDVGVGWMAGLPHDGTHISLHDPARALREVASGRRILARHTACATDGSGPCWSFPAQEGLCRELADLLYRWSDDPGYHPDWMPEGLTP